MKPVPGVTSALAERLNGGRYIDVDIDRLAAALRLSVADIQSVVSTAVGGDDVGEVIAGRERFPINLRYPREVRDSVENLRQLPVVTARGADPGRRRTHRDRRWPADDPQRERATVRLRVRRSPRRRPEHRRPHDAAGRRAAGRVAARLFGRVVGAVRVSRTRGGKLRTVVPVTLVVIFVLLFLTFGSAADALLLMSTVPFALVGGFWLVWALGHAVSVATSVGFIALAGVAAEFGVVMLLYLKGALQRRLDAGEPLTDALLLDAIREGAVLRVRPKAMTVAVVLAGLVPIMVGHGAGSEVMQRIAAPMVGGMVTAPLLSMFVIPPPAPAAAPSCAKRGHAWHSEAVPHGTNVPSIPTGESR